jgi:hypothetical protein
VIVRILGEGQFEVDDGVLDELNDLDDRLVEAIDRGDESGFADALDALLVEVRRNGSRLHDDYLGPSELMLPGPDATLDEVRALLSEEGLIPG